MSETVYPLAGGTPQRKGLRDSVYELILNMLMTSDIAPGTRLSIDVIARDLKVSPTPVREALVQLERTGLVTREALKGYRVAPPIHSGQLEALFDARLVLECGATELAAGHASDVVTELDATLEKQRELGEKVRGAFEAGGPAPVDLLREYFAVDWQFHHLIFEGTKNPFLLDMSEAISIRVHRMRQTVNAGVTDAPDAVIEHGLILDALRRQDGEAAAAAMRDHIEKVRERARQDTAAR